MTNLDRNYNQSYHGMASLTSTRGTANSTASRLRLLDANNSSHSTGGDECATRLAKAIAMFLHVSPAAAPLVAPALTPSTVWAARFALALDSSSLTCRLF